MKNKHGSFLLAVALIVSFLESCTGQGKSFVPPLPDYDVAGKETIILKKDLIEISGMCYMPNGNIAAINDEEGKIFIVNSSTGKFTESRFGRKRDYEDIVQAGGYYYVLESNGNIHRVPLDTENTEEEFEFPREKKIEFESLYYDAAGNRLVLLSKEQRETKNAILAYGFDIAANEFSASPLYTISLDDITDKLKDNIAQFKPSAAAIHPLTHKLFIVASVGKALLIYSPENGVESIYQLNPDQFPQPEGLTFAPNGDLFISNEGVHGKATILRFPYKKGEIRVK